MFENEDFEKLNLSEKDILVVYVDVGDLPKHLALEKSETRVQEIKTTLKDAGYDNKIIVFEKRNGEKQSQVEVLPIRSDKDRLVFNIATGNMPPHEAERYVSKLAKAYRDVNDELQSCWFCLPNNAEKTEVFVETKE